MSLRIEQKLVETEITESKPVIYTTGARLVPMKVQIRGQENYIWVVDEFLNDTYFDDNNISPHVFSDSINGLIE